MRAGLVIANSQWTAGRLALDGQHAHVEVVANAVELDRFDPCLVSRGQARGRLGLGRGEPVLGVVGQVTPWKAQSDAIRATSQLVSRWPDLKLLVVGSVKFRTGSTRYDNDAYMASLHRLVEELDLRDHVCFLGEREDVPDVLRALDLLLVPSWEEPFGRVVIEAMAMRTPVVATSLGGPAEVIDDGVDGRLLRPCDPGRWARAIEGLLADPGRLEAMGLAGRAKAVKRFDQRSQAARIAELYERLLAAGARS
jgi:glycosyltransferase involved in cell wall biosynthesis